MCEVWLQLVDSSGSADWRRWKYWKANDNSRDRYAMTYNRQHLIRKDYLRLSVQVSKNSFFLKSRAACSHNTVVWSKHGLMLTRGTAITGAPRKYRLLQRQVQVLEQWSKLAVEFLFLSFFVVLKGFFVYICKRDHNDSFSNFTNVR